MTLVSDIITGAFRESNIGAITQTQTTEQINEALARLQSIVYSVLGSDVGYNFDDWDIKAPASITKPNGIPMAAADISSWVIAPNARLVCNLTATVTLNMDPFPNDGQRMAVIDAKGNFATDPLLLAPNGRKINGSTATLSLNTNGVSQQWLYRADLANWILITTLATGDAFVFPPEFDDYFIIELAARISPRYGRELSPSALARLAALKGQLVDRYSQTNMTAPTPPAGAPQ